MPSELPEAIEVMQRKAAWHGLMLVRPADPLLDCLDLLSEIGGEGTIKQMRNHLGHGGWSWHGRRLRALVDAGLLERILRTGDGALYRLTAAGDQLRLRQ